MTLHVGSRRAMRKTLRQIFAALDAGAPLSIVGGSEWRKALRQVEYRRSTNGPADAGEGR